MAALRSFDDKHARLRELSGETPERARAELPRFLGDKSGFLVGEAADIAKQHELRGLGPELVAAFMRLIAAEPKADPACTGKCRIVEALLAMDLNEPDVFLAGLKHVQIEGAYPLPVDTAGPLRGLCAHALIQVHHRQALLSVTPLLFDPDQVTRAEAAAALGDSGQEGAAAVLHAKLLGGEGKADVLGAIYKALLRLFPERYLPVVKEALLGSVEVDGAVEAAALALGESRVEGALSALREGVSIHSRGREAEAVLLGIALLRTDAANACLLERVESAPEAAAGMALSALALHRHDAGLVARARAVVLARKSKKLAALFAERFERE
ncbi:MAG: hypothetical protein R3B70_01610 [Polyangiaceae bacterium]